MNHYEPISASWIFTLPFWLSALQSNYGECSATSTATQPGTAFHLTVLHLFTEWKLNELDGLTLQ